MLPAPSGRQLLTYADMERALTLLDAEIAKSELLMSVAPLRLITVGGSLAVRVCFNRDASYDIDCLLDPNVAAAADYSEEFSAAISTVADNGGYALDWLNQQVELFVARERRFGLFLESVQQGVIVYKGAQLVIYAGRLDWALERKIRRVAHARSRRGVKDVDVPDAAALVRMMRTPGGPPLSFQYVRELNLNGFDAPPTDAAIVEVAEYYARAYGEVGIADMVRDAETGRWKYQGFDKKWVWC
ncbi:hypothetical protein HRG_003401 [Hirsutella rhossiliensis]|uniref:Uncharacterized protein n=1 Tax=Hirsutella rhossiliensis TaxID=111463 RepID=A0A9P8N1X8_9HYPO|nr:uncharacterized protein HRG_03401 [Hirsutella rhossiliensis]KAH0965385.1 hypothetical protein HRG_03401 [Hirsutella rhossiliensis]